MDGFSALQGMRGTQMFLIHKAYGGTDDCASGAGAARLPSAHTCFNQLDLPVYSTMEELREKLTIAIKEGSEGFGFA